MERVEERYVIKVREMRDGAMWISGVGQSASGLGQGAGVPDPHDLAFNLDNVVSISDQQDFSGTQCVHVATADGYGWLLLGSYQNLILEIDVNESQ